MICPSTIAAYVLRDRKWTNVNVDEVANIPFRSDMLDKLLLPRGQKDLVLDLVMSQTQSRGESNSGLIILLCGPPGVGKTFTVTCVAETVRRPLLLIAIEGGNFMDVELTLNKSFQLAHRWGAILLVDDADIMLSSRSNNSNINAATGGAMRAIDKYTGILFLTTNRVSALDEALQSRIDYTLVCPELDKEARRTIWINLFEEALIKGSYIDIDDLKDHLTEIEKVAVKINGREIQKIFLAAWRIASLHKQRLCYEHIRSMLEAKNTPTDIPG
ncbi:P-loop containing nucleoside triphosphate hydrolase protein [Hyaloscypha finlandica]|nr:P-loop containing nucleoside triphosphate hydrolase protein [Hyaloscypha finlandica]